MPAHLSRFLLPFALAVSLFPAGALAATRRSSAKPAIEMNTKNLGKVVATPAKLGIYYWDTEKKAGGKMKCTGACAAQWPPVYVRRRSRSTSPE